MVFFLTETTEQEHDVLDEETPPPETIVKVSSDAPISADKLNAEID